MRIDQLEDDPTVLMGMMTAIQEFATELGPLVEDRRQTPRDDLVLDLGERRARRLPDGAVGARAGDGAVHLGRRRDDAHGHRARAVRADPSSRRVGSDGGRTRRDPGRGRGDHPLGDAAQQHVPHRDARRADRRHPGSRGRPGDPAVPVGQPRRVGVRRSVHVRHRARTRIRTSRSGSGRTSASARRSHGSSCACCSRTSTRRITNLRVVAEPDIEPNIFVGAVRSFRLGFDRRRARGGRGASSVGTKGEGTRRDDVEVPWRHHASKQPWSRDEVV